MDIEGSSSIALFASATASANTEFDMRIGINGKHIMIISSTYDVGREIPEKTRRSNINKL